ncbi:peptide ABC transporter [Skermanella stibiiresistens SB22]|uniref:Peptide ABC transporter n=1 Tax=Skermanella stibiiresistens SB22 TaxID=1385369 RepID=W9HAE2_9PROT|nr:ABC transporter ATP-binding protein [Skermanella stibiiresistens]EWY41652.1 peptide ABC transporter [Skermanella stibiiresistens SB22]
MTDHLTIKDLGLEFRTRHGVVRALEDVSLTVKRGEIVGVVGESGSGKSVMAYSVMGLSDAAAEIKRGSIVLGGMDLLATKGEALRAIRGREMAMIFQSPRTALNPIRKVGRQIEDVLMEHEAIPRRDLRKAAIAALERVRIPDPERRYDAYPFELSGGMCQRVMIAIALACSPSLLIADEPTTGLDVTTQAVIMDLIRDKSRDGRMSTLLITHDLGLAGEYCDRIVVMHAGHVVEVAPTEVLLSRPAHPYTLQLLAATPTPTSTLDTLPSIGGQLPDLRRDLPPCRFSERCARKLPQCDVPPLPWTTLSPDHIVRCRVPL